ncbi:SNPC3 protein, partial [Eubucco bourcierii]|nr:SNPC3 protein [Eubucco bourcierii]
QESYATGKRPDNPTDLVDEGDLLLTLNIYYPVIFQKASAKFEGHKDHKPYQTVLVLGSQKLTELRDCISCVSDLQIGGEFSSQPDQAPEHISKDLYKSAFFYFEGVFYNDKRYPECRDLSRTIIEWSETHDRGYGNLRSVKMEDYTFNDLALKIGFPYLFCHQGNCEHIVIITDTRLIHHDDCLDRNLYPLLIKKHWLCTRKCFVCKKYTARWVTNEDSLAPADPCLFCDVCFRMLHYDVEGNKLGEFLAYPYVDPGIFN